MSIVYLYDYSFFSGTIYHLILVGHLHRFYHFKDNYLEKISVGTVKTILFILEENVTR